MSTEMLSTEFTAPAFIDCVTSTDSTGMEAICESVYRLVFEAISNGTEEAAKQKIASFYELSDRLIEYLDLTGGKGEGAPIVADAIPDEKLKSFYLGQIVAATELLADMAQLTREQKDSSDMTKRSKHLRVCLTIVGANPGIPGTDLKKQLNLGNSAFSNFMKRVEPQHLFYVQKDGNTNYYTLSPRGRRFLRNSENDNGGRGNFYNEKFILILLSAIASEVSERKPNATRVILQANRCSEDGLLLGNTQLLKDYIQQIFDAFERDVEKKFKQCVRISISKMYRDSYNGGLLDLSDYSTYKPVYYNVGRR